MKNWLLLLLVCYSPILVSQVNKIHINIGSGSRNYSPAFTMAGNKLVSTSQYLDSMNIIDPINGSIQKIAGANLVGEVNNNLAVVTGGYYDTIYPEALDLNTLALTPLPEPPASRRTYHYILPANVAGLLFYWVTDDIRQQLWRSNGTPAGTMPLMQIDSGASKLNLNYGNVVLGIADGKYYFFTNFINDSLKLWCSDGSLNGTVPIHSFNSTEQSLSGQTSFVFGQYIYYNLSDGLWRTNIITGYTELVKLQTNSLYDDHIFIPADSDHLVFGDRSHYYITDGTNAGTFSYAVQLDSSLQNAFFVANMLYMGSVNGRNICINNFGKYGAECYRVTTDSMILIADANKGMYDFADIEPLFAGFDNKIYVVGNNGVYGRELWRTDGTVNGLELMADITPGPDGSKIMGLWPKDSFLFFAVNLPDGSTDIYRIGHGAFACCPLVAPDTSKKDVWTEVIGERYAYNGQIIPEDIAVSGTDVFVALNNYRQQMEFLKNDTITNNKGPVSVVKLNKNGQLQWVCDFSTNTEYFAEDLSKGIATDNQGNCILVNMAYQQLISGGDTFTSPRVFVYMAKINSNGHVIWTHTFNPTYYDNPYPWHVTIDADNNIYLAGSYDNGLFECQGQVIASRWQPANFMAKFDSNGNIIWLKNIPTDWPYFYSNFQKIIFDRKYERIYGLIPQYGYNTLMTCQYDSARISLFCMDTLGNMIWTKGIQGTDLKSATCLALDTNSNELIMEGKFRGSILFDGHTLNSYEDSGCTAYLPYFARLSAMDGRTVSANIENDKYVYPFDAVVSGQYLYTIAAASHQAHMVTSNYMPDGSNGLIIYRRTLAGELLDSIKYARNAAVGDIFESVYWPKMVADSDGYILFDDYFTDALDTILMIECTIDNPGISITRTDFPLTTAPPGNVSITGSDVLVFPNPFNDYVTLQADSSSFPYSLLEIYDISGRRMYTVPLSNSPLQKISVANLADGVYVFVLRGENIHSSLKMIKL